MIRKYATIVFIVILSSCEPSQDEYTSVLKFYGDALEDIGYSIAQTDNGYVIGGQFTKVVRDGNYIDAEKSSKQLGIIKTDLNGNLLWKHSFGNDKEAVGSKVIVLNDGSFVSVGYIIADTLTKQKDVYVVKISADGNSFTENYYPETGNQYGIDIIQTQEGFMILGSTGVGRTGAVDSIGNTSGKKDIYLLRINNNLELIGAPKAFGYQGNDAAVAIKNDINGGYVIIGTTDNCWPNQQLNNIFILKVNIYGEPTQIRILGTADDEYASDIEVLESGYLIAGTVGSDGTDQYVYLAKVPEYIFNTVIVIPKFKVSSASSTATSFSVKVISRYSTDSFVMAGQAGTGTSAKMLIFVTDADGRQVSGKELITTASGVQVAYDVISDDNDEIVVVGKNSFENNSMISLFKFRF